MVLIVVRHGESEWNKLNQFTGTTDVSLSENGITEAKIAGKMLKNYKFDFVFTSQLNRTFETSKIIMDQSIHEKITPVMLVDLQERDYGHITGKNKTELEHVYGKDQIMIWRRSYHNGPPGGESLHDVKLRVGKTYNYNIQKFVEEGKNILIVAHGNSLRALFVHLRIKSSYDIEKFEISTGVPIIIDTINKDYEYINPYSLTAYQIIDSRGYPTIEVKLYDKINKKFIGKGSTPSGASCGSTEVCELRDNEKASYHGKSVFKAINNINEMLNKKLVLTNKSVKNLSNCDKQFIDIDGTPLKSNLGGNTSTAFTFCIADAAANLHNVELYEYIAQHYDKNILLSQLPTPLVNIINGGKHGVTEDLKIQEFMIYSNEAYPINYKVKIYCEVYHTLKKILVEKYGEQAKSIGDEGGFCPPIYSADEALTLIEEAIEKSNYKVNEDVFIALDCAASEFYNKESKLYEIEKGKFLTGDELINYYEELMKKHPALKSIEDGFDEKDITSWKKFTELFGKKIMIVGDDLFTTNPELIGRGIAEKWANTLLLKVNQIGTITESIKGAKMMFEQKNNVIVSHRSGETNHAYIVDLAVGIGAKYLKIGSPCRGERVAKFNRLIEIENDILNKID